MTCELKPGIGRWLSMHKSLKVSERGEMRLQNEKMHVLTLSLSLSLSLTHTHKHTHTLGLVTNSRLPQREATGSIPALTRVPIANCTN